MSSVVILQRDGVGQCRAPQNLFMHLKSLVELSAALGRGEFSSEELTRACLARVATLDEQLNSSIAPTMLSKVIGCAWFGNARANGSA